MRRCAGENKPRPALRGKLARVASWCVSLRPGEGAIDIGANTGWVTKALADSVGVTGCVVAIEPFPGNVQELRDNMSKCPWVQVIQAAVSDTVGTRVLYLDRHGSRHSLWEKNLLKPTGDTPVEVPTVRLDDISATVPRLRVVKVDTQGCEVEVLRGGQETLKMDGLMWHVEFWPEGLRHAGSSVEELAAMFQAHGYKQQDGRTWPNLLEELSTMRGHRASDVVLVR